MDAHHRFVVCRAVFAAVLAGLTAPSFGQYTFRLLDSRGYQQSLLGDGGPETAGGWVLPKGGDYHAAFWPNSASAVIDLHPAGYGQSLVHGIAAGQQVGTASRPNGADSGGGAAL